jgi:hypothetical protein
MSCCAAAFGRARRRCCWTRPTGWASTPVGWCWTPAAGTPPTRSRWPAATAAACSASTWWRPGCPRAWPTRPRPAWPDRSTWCRATSRPCRSATAPATWCGAATPCRACPTAGWRCGSAPGCCGQGAAWSCTRCSPPTGWSPATARCWSRGWGTRRRACTSRRWRRPSPPPGSRWCGAARVSRRRPRPAVVRSIQARPVTPLLRHGVLRVFAAGHAADRSHSRLLPQRPVRGLGVSGPA